MGESYIRREGRGLETMLASVRSDISEVLPSRRPCDEQYIVELLRATIERYRRKIIVHAQTKSADDKTIFVVCRWMWGRWSTQVYVARAEPGNHPITLIMPSVHEVDSEVRKRYDRMLTYSSKMKLKELGVLIPDSPYLEVKRVWKKNKIAVVYCYGNSSFVCSPTLMLKANYYLLGGLPSRSTLQDIAWVVATTNRLKSEMVDTILSAWGGNKEAEETLQSELALAALS